MTGSRLRLSREQFDELAAGCAGAAAITVLNSAQLSQRLLLIRAVADQAGACALREPAALDDALRLLAAAHRRDPAAATAVLGHPHVAAWARRCLRLLADDSAAERSRADLGYLHAIAVAAAARAGLDFEASVPARDAAVGLPTLGTAQGLGDGPVRVRGEAGGGLRFDGCAARVRVPAPIGAAGPGWAPRRELALDGFTLAIEDLDSYRDCYSWPPSGRLDGAAADRLAELLRQAWRLIRREHPGHATAMRAGLRSVVPVTGPTRGAVSAASRWAYGSVAVSVPDDPATLALLLVHEFQHMTLGALLDLVPLHRGDGVARHFAPWRADPRPVGALLQGAYAHLGVAGFWRRRRRSTAGRAARHAEFEFAYWLSQTRRAVQTLASCGELTDEGKRFVGGMAGTLLRWAAEPVPVDISTGVRELVEAAGVRWRLANLRLPETELARLRGAWRADVPAPAPPGPARLVASPAPAGPAGPTGLAGLIRDRLLAPEPDRRTGQAGPADRAYLAGDLSDAITGYTGLIAGGGTDDGPWVGLALAMAAMGHPGAGVMRSRPEAVRALHDSLPDSPGPAPLARWLAGAAVPATADPTAG